LPAGRRTAASETEWWMTRTRGVSFEKMEQAILVAAGELFDQKGFNQTSLQDIADALGMSRPSVYHYFDNREQILATGVQRITERRNTFIEEMRGIDGDPVERLTNLMLVLGTLVAENPIWIRILLRDGAALPEDTRERDRKSRMAYLELIISALREGMDAGLIRPHDERVTALTIIAALGGLQGQYVSGYADVSPEDIARSTVDIILHGLVLEKPRKGTPVERGLELIREGVKTIERSTKDKMRAAD
jgi:AcrR family transcriptional regulator